MRSWKDVAGNRDVWVRLLQSGPGCKCLKWRGRWMNYKINDKREENLT